MRQLAAIVAALVLLVTLSIPALGQAPAAESAAVAGVLDSFHAAAARADEEAYFALLAPNGVFLGTDATERWDKTAFRAFAHPYFSQGKGWTFTPRDRHLDFSRDGKVAWFDELLDSATYGECRGTGVLEKLDGAWKITQYHLTIPMPNDLAKELVARIREVKAAAQKP
jgi:ketosteroid isomerase-like protein